MIGKIITIVTVAIIAACFIMLILFLAVANKPTSIIFTPELFLFMGISWAFLIILTVRESV